MKIAYVTGDIKPNGNFSFFHDLLANYPVPDPQWNHRLYLISPTWDRGLVTKLKNRCIDVRACFEDFQISTDAYWEKICKDLEDVDVIISGNITNLDEVLPDSIQQPIVSVSQAERGYKSPTGTYGSFYKPRFEKVAISKTAIEAFPEHVRKDVSVLYSGIDPGRLSQKIQREDVRAHWFPGQTDTIKLAMFTGTHLDSKGCDKAIAALEFLPVEWHLVVLSEKTDLKVPEHLNQRVLICPPTYDVADIFLAADCFVLPTEHEGLSLSLLEAWYLNVPTVTTKHKAMMERIARHQKVDFGQLVEVDHTPKELAEAMQKAKPSETAGQCVYQNYMASNMIESWETYLENLVPRK